MLLSRAEMQHTCQVMVLPGRIHIGTKLSLTAYCNARVTLHETCTSWDDSRLF
jgi:hypothetical protein